MTEMHYSFQQALNLGHTAAWDQDWKRAADYYRQAVDLSAEDLTALVSLGLAYLNLGSYEQSLDCYTRAAEISPDDPLPLEKISQLNELLGKKNKSIWPSLRASELYLGDGNLPKAIECLARVTRIDAENLPAHSRLALIYERTGRIKQAVTEFLIVASLMQYKGDEKNAQKAAEHALTLLPGSNEAATALALIEKGDQLPLPVSSDSAFDQQRLIEDIKAVAVERFEVETPALDPIAAAKQTAVAALANLVLERDDFVSGADRSNKKIGSDSSVSEASPIPRISNGDRSLILVHLRDAVEFHGNRLEDEAADEVEAAVELGFKHPAAYFYLGLNRSRGDRLESALRYLQRSLDDVEYAFASRLILGKTLRFMGRLSESTTNYMEALRLADSQTVLEGQAVSLMRMYDPIIEEEAKQTDPDVKNKLCDIIDDLLLRPNWRQNLEKVKADYQINIEGTPAVPVGEILSNPEGSRIVESVMRINQYARLGYMRSAMEEAYFAIQFAPTYLPLHTYMGELLIKQDRLPEAMDKFGVIAQTYHARGESLNAVQILQKIIRVAPMDLEARKQLITLYEERGQFKDAIQEKIKLAGVHYNLADLSRARSVYFEAYQLNQKTTNKELSVQILHRLADIELQSLEWKNAIQIYQEIRAIDTDNSQAMEKIIELNLRLEEEQEAMNELDEYLASMDLIGMNDQAMQFLGKITKENPGRISFRHKAVAYYLKKGDQDRAMEELDELSETLLEAGDKDGALRMIEEIIDLDPPNKADYQEVAAQLKNAD